MYQVKQQRKQERPMRRQTNTHNLKCRQNNQILRVCCNDQCQFSAFCCREQSCRTCSEAHEECSFRELTQLTKRIQNKLDLQQKLLQDMFRAEQDFIEYLQQTRKELLQYKKLKENMGNFHKFIYNIFEAHQVDGLNGKDINLFFHSIPIASVENLSKKCLQKYQENVRSVMRDLVESRETIFQQFFQHQTINRHRQDQKIKISQSEQASSHRTHETMIDSFILQKEAKGSQKLIFLMKELENPSELKLLFRASYHNFKANKFHQFCDGIKNTLTIIKTQFGKTIAGFTPLQWKSNLNYYMEDPSQGSFLLQLDMKMRMNLKNKKKALYTHKNFGPSFGSDIVIADECDKDNTKRNRCFFPKCYRCENEQINKKDKRKLFCGCQTESNFKIIEYQVFQVIK